VCLVVFIEDASLLGLGRKVKLAFNLFIPVLIQFQITADNVVHISQVSAEVATLSKCLSALGAAEGPLISVLAEMVT
jgi:hypothetical protein